MSDQSRIIFYSELKHVPDPPNTGGQKVVQQHMRILMREGYETLAVVTSWFSSHPEFPTIRLGKLRRAIRPTDYLVVPAFYCGKVHELPECRKVILNQNVPLLLSKLPPDISVYPWEADDVVACICVSDYDVDLMGMMSTNCPIHRVYNRLDTSGIESLPWSERDNVICTSPLIARKNRWHALMLAHLARVNMRDVRIVEIEGMEPREAMKTMAKAKTFLFPSIAEGFALMPLEAAYLRVPVIAYRNQAFEEYLPEDCLFEPGDIRSAWSAIRCAFQKPETWTPILDAAEKAARTYTREQQRKSVLRVWETITAGRHDPGSEREGTLT